MPKKPSWFDNLPVISHEDVSDGIYVAFAAVNVGRTDTPLILNNPLIYVEGDTSNFIYADNGIERMGYYVNNEGDLVANRQFAAIGISSQVNHINQALGTSFKAGAHKTANVDISQIIGKIAPIEGYSGINNLNVIEDELTDI